MKTIASEKRPVDIDEEMMRLTRTVVLHFLGGDLGQFAAKVDDAWTVVNRTSAKASGHLIHRQTTDAEAQAIARGAGRACGAR